MPEKIESKFILDAAVERIDDQTVNICWEPADRYLPVAVFQGNAPEAIERETPVAVSDSGCVQITGLDNGRRRYFELAANGDRMRVAERRIRLDGAVNFRDLGGYRTIDGRRVKWGRIYRSDGLARLTEADVALLQQMNIRRVVDFRTASEVEDAPDRLAEDGSMDYVHLPVTHGRFDFVEAVKLLKKGDTSWLTPDFMVNGYINNIEAFAESWAAVIHYATGPEARPLVFHCTGGKDRTGTCAALILLALGVPEETVIDDHQLSNIYIAELLPKFYEMMAGYGIDPDKLFPYLTAPRECIVSVIDYINAHYGTAAEYLIRKSSVTPEILEHLGADLLE